MEVSVQNQNNISQTYLDTLYSGCTIGSYSVLMEEDYTMIGKATEDCTVLKLPYKSLSYFRDKFDELDIEISEYEKYISENGLPYCDYKLDRNRFEMSMIERFQNSVRRIMRILKSYKSNAFTDLLVNIQEQIKKERKEKNKAYRKKVINSVPQTKEEKIEKSLFELGQQVTTMADTISKQF